jgi:uncharacterized protein YjbI with pentapeptide repeats
MGLEDSCFHHLQLLRDLESTDLNTIDLDKRTSTNILSKRFFSVKSIENLETLALNFNDIDTMKKDFRTSSIIFLKWQIRQAFNILVDLRRLATTERKKKSQVVDAYSVGSDVDGAGLRNKNLRNVRQFIQRQQSLNESFFSEIGWSSQGSDNEFPPESMSDISSV